jgi:phosphatidylserine/phosphatidylglycerophosphate/cardiolipin synthase-like enzyme
VALANLQDLVKFKRGADKIGWPPGYPTAEYVKFYSPDDRVDGALQTLIWSVEHSLCLAMYGFDDQVLADTILEKMRDPNIFVQITLDSTQAAGRHEKELLTLDLMASNSVAIGRSRGGGIMHLKEFIIDGLDVGSGSTNWSTSGETKQDNVLTVVRNAIVAADSRKQLDLIHGACLEQMRAKAAKTAV